MGLIVALSSDAVRRSLSPLDGHGQQNLPESPGGRGTPPLTRRLFDPCVTEVRAFGAFCDEGACAVMKSITSCARRRGQTGTPSCREEQNVNSTISAVA